MKITIKDLHEGINEFEQEIPSENYKMEDIGTLAGPLYLHIFVDKLESLFRFKITLQTVLNQSCDRCLAPFSTDFAAEIEQIYHLGPDDLESDEIEVLPVNTKEIDISAVIHDAFVLNRPLKQVCRDDCRGLCPNCGINRNMKDCDCEKEDIDPRFAKLKSLLK